MIVYQSTKAHFVADTHSLGIEYDIARAYLKKTGRYAPDSELRAWRESLRAMAGVLADAEIPANAGVGIEFGIPQSSKRIDFLLSGQSAEGDSHLIIVELKQWSTAQLSDKPGIVIANRGGGAMREGPHPCYQAWSYAALLEGFNEAVYEQHVGLRPCAYLHGYASDGVIDHPSYDDCIELAPLFLKGEKERERLRDFIKRHIALGDDANLLYTIEHGRIRPSKMLADSLASMLKGNREFVLIDEQKVVFETAMSQARSAGDVDKRVLIVRGGPGTGKSVVAVNLLVALSKQGLLARYVSKNAAPRAVYEAKLRGSSTRLSISTLFSGSGSYTDTPANAFDVLVVDEAHRLNERSGLYANLGENQIKELIHSAKCTIFFVDDDQIVTLADIGRSDEIERWGRTLDASVAHLELSSQFRCNGSDGYLAWLDQALGLRETAHLTLDVADFDFRLIDSPVELHRLIAERNRSNNKSRVVAGYCWDWRSKRTPQAYDIVMPEHGYQRRWNLSKDGSLWIMAPDSIEEVGCIHTCQGLELDYVGVIIGPDLYADDGVVCTAPAQRSRMDRSIRGYKALAKKDPERARDRVDRIIRNTYRTLMTRGLKGCYVYCVDPGLKGMLAERIVDTRAGS